MSQEYNHRSLQSAVHPGSPPQVRTAGLGGSTIFFFGFFLFWAVELHRRNNINIILDADNYNCVFRRSEGRTHCSMLHEFCLTDLLRTSRMNDILQRSMIKLLRQSYKSRTFNDEHFLNWQTCPPTLPPPHRSQQ